MDRTEEVFVSLFSRLREDLREESGVGLALKAEGRNVTIRIHRQSRWYEEGPLKGPSGLGAVPK